MRQVVLLWACAVLVTGSSGAGAQQMYRCGSVYQDRPCVAGSPEKVMRSSASDASLAGNPKFAVDHECIRRGMDAQQIVWSRESGKTAEDLMRTAQTEQQRQLIAEVYAQRGPAPQVRDTVQARCQRDRETTGGMVLPYNGSGNSGYPRPLGSGEAPQDSSAAKAAANQSSNCDYFKAEQEFIRNQERQGGSIQVMESLRLRRNNAEKAARAKGC